MMKECATCEFLGRPTYKSPCSECRDFNKWSGDEDAYEKPITNADHIRSMSDEELEKILNAFAIHFVVCDYACVECEDCELYKLCHLPKGRALDWLKQPFGGNAE
jgi:hypothetical protein